MRAWHKRSSGEESFESRNKVSAPEGWKGWPSDALATLPPFTVKLPAAAISREWLENLFDGKGGEGDHLDTFTKLRHKAVHWLAPVPEEMARRLLEYYRTVLKQLIPLVVAHLREDATELDPVARERLDDWEQRLLEAAEGRIPEDCKPLSYRQVRDRVSAV